MFLTLILILAIANRASAECAAIYFFDIPYYPLDMCMAVNLDTYGEFSYQYECLDGGGIAYQEYEGLDCSGNNYFSSTIEEPTGNYSEISWYCDEDPCSYGLVTLKDSCVEDSVEEYIQYAWVFDECVDFEYDETLVTTSTLTESLQILCDEEVGVWIEGYSDDDCSEMVESDDLYEVGCDDYSGIYIEVDCVSGGDDGGSNANQIFIGTVFILVSFIYSVFM